MTVTQTWRVGPRSNPKEGERRREVDTGRTITLHRRRLTVTLLPKERRFSQQRKELLNGVNSFSIHNGRLDIESGRKDTAAFEIELNEAGAFYFGVRERLGAKLNGRVVGWARLRFDDVIEVDGWTVRIDNDRENERTVVVPSLKQGLKRPRRKRTLALASALVLLLAGVVGGLLLLDEEVPSKLEEAHSGVTPLPVSISPPPEAVEPPPTPPPSAAKEIEEERDSFTRAKFDESVQAFRSGDEKRACEKLRHASTVKIKNVWTDKAALFVKRRCQTG